MPEGTFNETEYKRQFDALVLLICRGANVFATDIDGVSIFQTAYTCHHSRFGDNGAFRGDLLDAVLVECGYGEHIRKRGERLSHYEKRYTRWDFEWMWKGRERLCPYFSEDETFCPDSLIKYPRKWSLARALEREEGNFNEENEDSEGSYETEEGYNGDESEEEHSTDNSDSRVVIPSDDWYDISDDDDCGGITLD